MTALMWCSDMDRRLLSELDAGLDSVATALFRRVTDMSSTTPCRLCCGTTAFSGPGPDPQAAA
jgi:hypothetical protein